MKLGKYEGEADYGYVVVERDTLLEGPFSIKKSSLEALLDAQDFSFNISGDFEKGYPQGFWRFRFGEFKTNSESQVVDYQYRVSVSGIQEEASGLLNEGRPDGPWMLAVNRIRDSEIDTALFRSSVLFENGVPQRNFRIENESHILVGRFLRNGLAHDEWSLYAVNGMEEGESWFFEEGLLKKIQFRRKGETLEIPFPTEPLDSIKVVNLDQRYVKALRLRQRNRDTLQFSQAQIPRLLVQNAKFYEKINDLLSRLGKSTFAPGFQVGLPHYPLDSLERGQLDSIAFHFKRAKVMADSILGNTQLNILKLSDAEALFLHNVVTGISSDFLDPLERLVQYNGEGVLEFVPREELMQRLWPDGRPSPEIGVDVSLDSVARKRTFVLPDAHQFNFKGDPFTAEAYIARYADKAVESIQSTLAEKLIREQREQELIALEEKLIAQGKTLYALLDSLGREAPGEHKDLLQQIRILADNNLSAYAGDSEDRDKPARARELIQCHDQLGHLAKIIGQLPDQWEEIQQKYQDAVWNPFTATVMNEEVKRRITSAYNRILVPHYLEQVKARLDCDTIEKSIILFENTHQRLLQMRDEDTSKLERKLRRENDPLQIMQLFGINPNQKGK